MLLCPSEKTTHLPHVTLSNFSLPEEPPIQCVIEVAGRENWEWTTAQVKAKVKQQAIVAVAMAMAGVATAVPTAATAAAAAAATAAANPSVAARETVWSNASKVAAAHRQPDHL